MDNMVYLVKWFRPSKASFTLRFDIYERCFLAEAKKVAPGPLLYAKVVVLGDKLQSK